MINAQDIKNGTCIRMDGRLYFCVEFLHVKPGKGNTFMRTKLKDVVDGRVIERRFNIGEKLEDVRVERRPYQYLYQEGGDDIFMNNETFEQLSADAKAIGDNAKWLLDQAECIVTLWNGQPISVTPPNFVELEIVDTDPGLKGDTAGTGGKPATLSTGAVVKVPLFVQIGEVIKVDTRSGEYVSRVK